MRETEHVARTVKPEIPTKYLPQNLYRRNHLEDLFVHEKIILKCLKEIGWYVVDRIHLAQYMDHWLFLKSNETSTPIKIW
jgi:hypothetical protein